MRRVLDVTNVKACVLLEYWLSDLENEEISNLIKELSDDQLVILSILVQQFHLNTTLRSSVITTELSQCWRRELNDLPTPLQ